MTHHNGNGKASPFAKVACDVRHVAHDVVELSELQASLLKAEFQGWWKQFLTPIVLFGVAGVIAASCIVVLLLSGAYALVELASMSMALSLLLVGVAGVLLAGIIGFVGKSMINKSRSPFPESIREFSKNIRWIKTALKDAAHPRTRSTSFEELDV